MSDDKMKTEYLLLVGAACAACETGDTAGLYGVLQLLQIPKQMPRFNAIMAELAVQAERQRPERALEPGERPQ